MHTKLEIDGKALSRFFDYATERYEIYLKRRSGMSKPWTNDQVLRNYRFCNVFREDDVVTKFICENIRSRLEREAISSLPYGMLVSRIINRVSSLQKLIDHGEVHHMDSMYHFKTCYPEALIALGRATSPWITGAYMVKTPPGIDKPSGVAYIFANAIETCYRVGNKVADRDGCFTPRQQNIHAYLMTLPYIGGFLAYEVVTDLTKTSLLKDAPDLDTWCHMGPGAQRGIRRICGIHDVEKTVHIPTSQHTLGLLMEILRYSKEQKYWPQEWPVWSMREVEHTLCEFDKYERARLQQGEPKQRYRGY